MFDRAVVNAGPLIALSLLDSLDFLPTLFAECWVPRTVYNEVSVADIDKPGGRALLGADWQARIMVSPVPDPLLVMELDDGEAEVICLARHLSPCMAIIDERRGRRIARHVYGLPVKGTAGILVAAKRRGLISVVRPLLQRLRLSGYYLADNVISAACLAVGE
jgi:predicted nucleic acid-binding protein